jgi:hypothetical protein
VGRSWACLGMALHVGQRSRLPKELEGLGFLYRGLAGRLGYVRSVVEMVRKNLPPQSLAVLMSERLTSVFSSFSISIEPVMGILA